MTQTWRPRAHFTPARHWMNDPNGLVHHDGLWHLFFQYNPEGADWGFMSWGHATSSDLVHWTEQPVALWHDSDGRGNGEQVFSGSVVVDHDNTSGLGQDGDEHPPFVAVFTSARPGHQAQSLAYSRDGGVSWQRYAGNPVLDRGSDAFRDPKVSWWQPADGGEGFWLMVAVEAVERLVVFYRSANLRDWELLSELGPLPGPVGFWECPDLFPLPVEDEQGRVGHVLVMSGNDETVDGCTTWYAVGAFDGTTFTMEDKGFQRLDHGPDNYAAVTWNDAPDGRRVLVGWMNNWAYARELPTTPWRGAMTLPRELSLRERSRSLVLVQRPVSEVRADQRLQRHVVELDVQVVPTVEMDLAACMGVPVRVTYDRDQAILAVHRDSAAGAATLPAAFGTVSTCEVLPDQGVVRLELIVDACSVEIFAAGGEAVLTALVFPDAPGAPSATSPDLR